MREAASASCPRRASEPHRAVGSEIGAGRLRRRLDLVHQRGGRGQLAREEVHVDALAERERELAERARLTRELDVPLRERLPPRVVPEMHGRHGRQPLPAQLLGRRTCAAVSNALFARRKIGTRGLIALAEERHQAVEQQVGSARDAAARAPPLAAWATSSMPPPGAASRPANIAADSASRYVSRARTGSSRLSRRAAPREQRRRRRCRASTTNATRARSRSPCARCEVVELVCLGRLEQPDGIVERARAELRLRGGQRTLRRGARSRVSARRRARGTRPRRRSRPAPARERRSARAPRRPPRPASRRPARGATRGGRGRPRDRSPRRGRDGSRAARFSPEAPYTAERTSG